MTRAPVTPFESAGVGDKPRRMTRLSAGELLRLPVRVGDITLGYPTDVILDAAARQIVGFDVVCRDGDRRFLPLQAATVGAQEITATSALTLLDRGNAEFYRRRGRSLNALRGGGVARDGQRVGDLRDLIVAANGMVEAIVLAGGETHGEVALEGHVVLGTDGATRRA